MALSDLSLDLPRDNSAPGMARRAIDGLLGDRLDARSRGDLALVVSELVTNAVVHGQGRISLRIRQQGAAIVGEVIDEGGGFEREVRQHGPEVIGGRGLLLVEMLCRRWGIHEGTTHVWFEFNIDAESGDALAEPSLGEGQRPQTLGL